VRQTLSKSELGKAGFSIVTQCVLRRSFIMSLDPFWNINRFRSPSNISLEGLNFVEVNQLLNF
jgi:hypothetical protein